MIRLLLNGQEQQLPKGLTVQKALEHLSVDTQRIAIEVNGRILPRKEWIETELKDHDVVEVVHFVGGGSTP